MLHRIRRSVPLARRALVQRQQRQHAKSVLGPDAALGVPARAKDPRLAQDYDANRDALRFRAYLPGRRPFT